MLTNEASFDKDGERPLTPQLGGVMMTSSFSSADDVGAFVLSEPLETLEVEINRVERNYFGDLYGLRDAPAPSPLPSPPSSPVAQAWRSAPDLSMLRNSCEVIGTREEVLACLQLQTAWRRYASSPDMSPSTKMREDLDSSFMSQMLPMQSEWWRLKGLMADAALPDTARSGAQVCCKAPPPTAR